MLNITIIFITFEHIWGGGGVIHPQFNFPVLCILHNITSIYHLFKYTKQRTQSVNCLQINDKVYYCCGIKMYEMKKTLVYAYLYAYCNPKFSDQKYLPDG